MKVVLKQDVKSIGKKDGMYEVSDGYARNFLFPRKLAVPADAAAVNEVKTKAAAQEHHKAEELAQAKAGRCAIGRKDGFHSSKSRPRRQIIRLCNGKRHCSGRFAKSRRAD